MTQQRILITGAGGEIGHELLSRLGEAAANDVIAMDLKGISEKSAAFCAATHKGDILDDALLERIFEAHKPTCVIHLAAMLSSSGERNPERAFDVNVNGTMNLLRLAARYSDLFDINIPFLFPSTIAVYGLPDVDTKKRAGRVDEESFLNPITMYGVNKLSCEHLGRYYTHHYGALEERKRDRHVDFRALRFPGLISAETVPSGGTSDYIPEMLHAAAEGQPYACFARSDTRIPFMTMPDAVESILRLLDAPESNLTRTVYNVGAFAPSAKEAEGIIREAFPDAEVSYEVDQRRQQFLDTWPEDVDDSAARRDWGYSPEHTLEKAFGEYLFPGVAQAKQVGSA
jgi:nucleoside-diphosphate-sugar epimerase